ncbi:hypothetical protein [Gemmata sp.]|uniref:hypothetical protein n=1 Tax=Gemmata sp. TaxID=1914242 RepID=UPI003F6F3756
MFWSKLWEAQRELNKIAPVRPYSYWFGGAHLAVATVGLTLARVAQEELGWELVPGVVFVLFAPSFLLQFAILLFLARRLDRS